MIFEQLTIADFYGDYKIINSIGFLTLINKNKSILFTDFQVRKYKGNKYHIFQKTSTLVHHIDEPSIVE